MLKLFFKSKRHHSLVEDALLKLFGFLYNGRDQREADLLFFNNAIKISSQFDYFEVSLGGGSSTGVSLGAYYGAASP